MFIQEEGQEAHTVTFLANKGPMQPGANCFEGQGSQREQPVKANGGFFMLTRPDNLRSYMLRASPTTLVQMSCLSREQPALLCLNSGSLRLGGILTVPNRPQTPSS